MFSKLIFSRLNIKKSELHQPRSLWSTFKNAFLRQKNLKKFWARLDKSAYTDDLIKTTDLFLNSESYKWTSKFWRHLIINHYNHIKNTSSDDPLNAIAMTDYAGFTYVDEYSIEKSDKNINKKINFSADIFNKHPHLTLMRSIHYNIILLLIYHTIKDKKIFGNYDQLNKNIYLEYNPKIKIDNKLITQHMLISLLEYEKISILTKNKKENLHILELGAGYGRTANIFLSLMNNCKYVIADLPPALHFSKNNLKKFFPNKKITTAFEVNDEEKIKSMLAENDVLFIFPHQIKLFKNKTFDAAIAIGVLNEMEKKMIKKYMGMFEVVSKSLYFKVWENSGLPYSFYKYYSVHNKSDYFIKNIWKEHFKNRCILPSNVFELGYEFK